jgi:simple sugar transport system substrate-binding protein
MKSVTSKIRMPRLPAPTQLGRRNALGAISAVGAASLWPAANPVAAAQTEPALEIGFVYVTAVTEAGWTAQHDRARRQLEQTLGPQVRTRFVANVAEGPDAERVIRDLAQQGARLIFATSFGFMQPTLKVAREFPEVAFEHATGYQTAANVGIYNARFYEGRYLAGMLAGAMTRTRLAGYVAAFPIPEVLQGINAFLLGMRAVNPAANVRVVWTSSWFDPSKEKEAALALINQGADVLTHHTDSTAVVSTAEQRGCYSLGYHSDMSAFAPKGHLGAVTHHWGEYCTGVARRVLEGRWKPESVWGGIREGFIRLEGLHRSLPAALREQVKAKTTAMASAQWHPFSGRLVDRDGGVRQAGGAPSDEVLNRMDYLLEGVQGTVPKS